MPAEVKKTVRRKLRTGPIRMLFPCADVLIDNSGLVAGMTEVSRCVIFRVVPLEEVMLVFPVVDQEKLVILLQRACLNVRLEAKMAVPVIPGINDGLHDLLFIGIKRHVAQFKNVVFAQLDSPQSLNDLVVQSGLEDRLLVGDVQQHELPVVVRQSVFQKAASRSRRPETCDSDIAMLQLNSGRTEIVFSVRPLFFGIREF